MTTMHRTRFRQIVESVALAGCAAALSLSTVAQTPTPNRPSGHQTAAQKSTGKDTQNVGERKFQENCSRCHTAPEQLSPHITGTIVMHMRVRASLSDQDAKDILRYLSP